MRDAVGDDGGEIRCGAVLEDVTTQRREWLLGDREEALAWLARIDPATARRPEVARQIAAIRASLSSR